MITREHSVDSFLGLAPASQETQASFHHCKFHSWSVGALLAPKGAILAGVLSNCFSKMQTELVDKVLVSDRELLKEIWARDFAHELLHHFFGRRKVFGIDLPQKSSRFRSHVIWTIVFPTERMGDLLERINRIENEAGKMAYLSDSFSTAHYSMDWRAGLERFFIHPVNLMTPNGISDEARRVTLMEEILEEAASHLEDWSPDVYSFSSSHFAVNPCFQLAVPFEISSKPSLDAELLRIRVRLMSKTFWPQSVYAEDIDSELEVLEGDSPVDLFEEVKDMALQWRQRLVDRFPSSSTSFV
jgi:hypothetical protein